MVRMGDFSSSFFRGYAAKNPVQSEENVIENSYAASSTVQCGATHIAPRSRRGLRLQLSPWRSEPQLLPFDLGHSLVTRIQTNRMIDVSRALSDWTFNE